MHFDILGCHNFSTAEDTQIIERSMFYLWLEVTTSLTFSVYNWITDIRDWATNILSITEDSDMRNWSRLVQSLHA